VSNHFSGGFKFPGDDARLDLTDVFAFVSPEDSTKTVLIIDVNPLMTAPAFHPDAIYRINVDNDGDAHADVAFTVVFSKPDDGMQTGDCLPRIRERSWPTRASGRGHRFSHARGVRRLGAARDGRPMSVVHRRAQ